MFKFYLKEIPKYTEELMIHLINLTNRIGEDPGSFGIDSIYIENRILDEYHIVNESSSEDG